MLSGWSSILRLEWRPSLEGSFFYFIVWRSAFGVRAVLWRRRDPDSLGLRIIDWLRRPFIPTPGAWAPDRQRDPYCVCHRSTTYFINIIIHILSRGFKGASPRVGLEPTRTFSLCSHTKRTSNRLKDGSFTNSATPRHLC